MLSRAGFGLDLDFKRIFFINSGLLRAWVLTQDTNFHFKLNYWIFIVLFGIWFLQQVSIYNTPNDSPCNGCYPE
jgi:hypothetical protein